MILTLNLSQPSPRDGEFRRLRRPLVLACGCFDVLTVGHVRHLQAAKRLGEYLCVLVTADRYVNKGPSRPVVPEDQRLELVDALGCVDLTILNPYPTAVVAIHTLAPDVYVKGTEYKGCDSVSFGREVAMLKVVGGRLEFTDTDGPHTSEVVARVQRLSREDLGCRRTSGRIL